jgi:hypothetical protein
MKGLNELAEKFAYFAGHNDWPEQWGPSDSSTYYYPGMSIDWQDFHPNEEKSLDHKRDGEDFTEEDTDWVDGEDDNEDQDDEKIEEIKKHMRSGKKKKQDVLQPSPFYSRMYGISQQGIEGTYSSPLEYYSGSVLNGPDGSEM